MKEKKIKKKWADYSAQEHIAVTGKGALDEVMKKETELACIRYLELARKGTDPKIMQTARGVIRGMVRAYIIVTRPAMIGDQPYLLALEKDFMDTAPTVFHPEGRKPKHVATPAEVQKAAVKKAKVDVEKKPKKKSKK